MYMGNIYAETKSFPTRERGLKFASLASAFVMSVVPHAGTWIEIAKVNGVEVLSDVVPHAGTWIEIHQDTPL